MWTPTGSLVEGRIGPSRWLEVNPNQAKYLYGHGSDMQMDSNDSSTKQSHAVATGVKSACSSRLVGVHW